jgi:chloramphenicol O-acetyltransferase
VHDKWGWNAGVVPTDLEDVTSVIEEVTTNSSGEFVRTLVWASAQPVNGQRDFDLVANVADEKGNFDTKVYAGH